MKTQTSPRSTASEPVSNDKQPQNGESLSALLEESLSLQESLRQALSRSIRLAVYLKHYRRQSKTLEATLQALRQLQGVEV
jgi:hypothetical protein